MTLPNTFAALTAPQMAFLDQNFAAVAALGIIPCTASGNNTITLSPNANTPTVTAYANYQQFAFVAVGTSSTSVNIQVGSLAALPVYGINGTVQAGSGSIVLNTFYVIAFDSAVNSGNGGWRIVSSSSITGVTAGTYNTVTVDASGRVTSTAALRGYLAGMTISNDSSSLSRSINVAVGNATDSTNTVSIVLSGTINKTITGAWAAGAGQSALGTGITLQSSTWYHVLPIINNGVADFYLDTVSSAANAPVNTTAFRRVGSILTNNASTSGQISVTPFVQNGDEFIWKTTVNDVNATATIASRTLYTLSVPPSVQVEALFRGGISNAGTTSDIIFTCPDENDQAPSGGVNSAPGQDLFGAAGVSFAGRFTVRTNVASQIGARAVNSGTTVGVNTYGFVDTRGRFV